MSVEFEASRVLPAAVVAAALGAMGTAAMAAQLGSTQSVDIQAQKLESTISRHSRTGIPEDVVSLSQGVSYADLDLATPQGAHELKNRIHETAALVCERLGKLFPTHTLPEEMIERASCVGDAVSGAMQQARTVIASAEQQQREGR